MSKIKVFFYLIVFLAANKAIAQSIDTISIKIDYPFAYDEAHCTALKVIGTETSEFTATDTANYSFEWTGTSVPTLNSLNTVIFPYDTDGSKNIGLTVVELATSTSFSADTIIDIQIPTALVVPNVFTPNDDGVNDLFKVFYDGITELEITIFSQTGTEVFRAKAPSIVWDGRNASGAKASEGIYYYVLTTSNPDVSANGFLYIYNYDPNN